MKALGTEEADNLDGGGSTTVTVGPAAVNRPSDATGERPIGDAITILP
jgi:exopolysaccharide biosynthesis protein